MKAAPDQRPSVGVETDRSEERREVVFGMWQSARSEMFATLTVIKAVIEVSGLAVFGGHSRRSSKKIAAD
jgi:hypothetical protein